VQFKELAKEADVAIIHLHGGEESCPGFTELMEYLQEDVKVHIQPSSAEDMPTVNDIRVFRLKFGGRQPLICGTGVQIIIIISCSSWPMS